MIKRTFVSALVLSLLITVSLIPPAFAYCVYCEDYPHAPWYLQNTDHHYEQFSDQSHFRCWRVARRCQNCDAFLEYDPTGSYEYLTEDHSFVKGKCVCGYRDPSYTSSNDHPSREDLMSEAQQLGEQAVGSMAKVLHAGNVRSSAASYADVVGKVYLDETYEILEFSRTYDGSVWYKIYSGAQQGWVSAGLVEVLPISSTNGGVMQHLVGRRVTIKVGSGNLRSEPGTASAKVGIVRRGKTYSIKDCGYDQSGYLWYKIRVDYVDGWVSAGIVDIQ